MAQTDVDSSDPAADAADQLDAQREAEDDAEAGSDGVAGVRAGVYLSALRCVVTYVLLPALGGLGIVLGPLGLGLQVLAGLTSTTGAIRLWRLEHRLRLPYAALAVVIDVATVATVAGLFLRT